MICNSLVQVFLPQLLQVVTSTSEKTFSKRGVGRKINSGVILMNSSK